MGLVYIRIFSESGHNIGILSESGPSIYTYLSESRPSISLSLEVGIA